MLRMANDALAMRKVMEPAMLKTAKEILATQRAIQPTMLQVANQILAVQRAMEPAMLKMINDALALQRALEPTVSAAHRLPVPQTRDRRSAVSAKDRDTRARRHTAPPDSPADYVLSVLVQAETAPWLRELREATDGYLEALQQTTLAENDGDRDAGARDVALAEQRFWNVALGMAVRRVT